MGHRVVAGFFSDFLPLLVVVRRPSSLHVPIVGHSVESVRWAIACYIGRHSTHLPVGEMQACCSS
jgi:hypothetical protein